MSETLRKLEEDARKADAIAATYEHDNPTKAEWYRGIATGMRVSVKLIKLDRCLLHSLSKK